MNSVKKCLALFLCGLVVNSAFAADKPAAAAKKAKAAVKEEAKKARRIVEGSVVHVSKRAISVEYEVKGTESNEMMLPLGAKLTLEGGIKSLEELKYGDRVKVGIEQTYTDNPDGTTTTLKTEALVVALVQRASEATAAPAGATAAQ